MRNIFGLKQGVSHFAIMFGCAIACPALAQDSDDNNIAAKGGLENIVVTAQKREESAQSTPISMNVLSQDIIEKSKIDDIADVRLLSPGLSYTKGTLNQFGATFALRGVSAWVSHESPVGVYVDDVYAASQSRVGTNGIGLTGLLDVSRIEVLKGPQGTLYGRNTAAGAVNIYSNLPTDEYEGSLRAQVGNKNFQQYTGIINLPVGGPSLTTRFAGEYAHSDGHLENARGGENLDAYDRVAVKGTAVFEPTDSLAFTLRGQYGKAEGTGKMYHLVGFRPPGTLSPTDISLAVAQVAFELTGDPTNAAAGAAGLAQYARGPEASFAPSFTTPKSIGDDTFETYGGSLISAFDLTDSVLLKSVTGYLVQSSHDTLDIDSTPFDINYGTNPVFINQFSQEFTISGSALGERLDYATGLFYIDIRKDDYLRTTTAPYRGANATNESRLNIENVSWALYGQATYSLTDSFRVTGGLRYTEETKDDSFSRISDGGVCLVPPTQRINGECRGYTEESYNNTSYEVRLEYDIAPEVLLYVKNSTGFRAGAINIGTSTEGTWSTYPPETIIDYEGGMKAQFFDNRARLNLAYFYYDYTDQQKAFLLTDTVPDGMGGTAPLQLLLTRSAASAEIQGIEFEAAFEAVPGLVLSALGAWNDASYKSYVDDSGDHSAQKFVDNPKWTYTLSANYTAPFRNVGTLSATIDWYWRSRVDLGPQDETGPQAWTEQAAYGLLNGRLAIDIDAWDVTIAAWGKNLTDEAYFTGNSSNYESLGLVSSFLGPPRTYGAEITKRF